MIGNLKRVMANVGGPVTSKRRILSFVVDSIILYGAPVWQGSTAVGRDESQGILQR